MENTVFLNSAKLNFDNKFDFSSIAGLNTLTGNLFGKAKRKGEL
ncbi:hypothetical protein [Clostridium estertheticum]|nr:hypothetical protein [Clostridium estertheticum]